MERPDVEDIKYDKTDKGFYYTDYHLFMDDQNKYIDHVESQLKEERSDTMTIKLIKEAFEAGEEYGMSNCGASRYKNAQSFEPWKEANLKN